MRFDNIDTVVLFFFLFLLLLYALLFSSFCIISLFFFFRPFDISLACASPSCIFLLFARKT